MEASATAAPVTSGKGSKGDALTAPCPPDDLTAQPPRRGRRRSFAALTVGAVGVVFGDIGTSPLYALREAIAHARPIGGPRMAVLGVVSLILWTLTLIVTIKYVLVLMRAQNQGEGGRLP